MTPLAPIQATFREGLRRLDLVSRRGSRTGQRGEQTSSRKGQGVEFADHRPYVPGDDPRFLDWAAYARQGRPVVKEFLEETDLALTIVIDASASMALPDEASRYRVGATIGFVLCSIALLRHNRAGVLIVTEQGVRYLPPSRGEAQGALIREGLESVTPTGRTRLAEAMATHFSAVRPEGLVWVISDLYDPAGPDHVVDCLVHFGLDGGVILMTDDREVDAIPIGPAELTDTETAERLRLVISPERRTAMSTALKRWHSEVAGYARDHGVFLVEAEVHHPIEATIQDWARRGWVVR